MNHYTRSEMLSTPFEGLAMPPRKPLLPLEPIPDMEGVYRARRGAAAMAAIKLRDGGLALYSPVTGLTPGAIERMTALGGVSAIIAPNHFHHLALTEYLEAFPGLPLYAPIGAHRRLEKQTSFSFEDVQDLMPALPDGVRLHQPQGLKAQEVWVEVLTGAEAGLIVCDAFGAPAKEDGLPPSEASPRGSFKTMCLKDAEVYCDWAKPLFARIELTHLLPCHGARVTGKGLSAHLSKSLEAL
ncbi:MAG: hypothetical protein AAFX90_19725 [Pseudomonadota bacterium]